MALTLSRVLWLSYTGGNIREWSLWTATPARKTPRRIRFAARDVDAPAPIVLGPGTNVGVPYAVDREITYLGDDGRALIRATVDSPVRLIAAGSGTPECGIVAAVASGAVLCVDGAGTVKQVGAYPPGNVRAVALGPAGAVFQVAREIVTSLPGTGEVGRMTLPAGATMVDIGQERVVWERRGDLGVTVFATRRSTLLADGSPARPVLGRVSGDGFAWARGRSVHWRPGRLP